MRDKPTLILWGLTVVQVAAGFAAYSAGGANVLAMLFCLITFRFAMLTEKDWLRAEMVYRGADQAGRNLVSGRDEWAPPRFENCSFEKPVTDAERHYQAGLQNAGPQAFGRWQAQAERPYYGQLDRPKWGAMTASEYQQFVDKQSKR